MPKLTIQARKPTKLPKLYRASGHVVKLIEYVKLAQRSLPVSQRPYVHSRAVAKTLRARGYDIASHTASQRAIANVSLTRQPPRGFEYVVHGERLARIYT